MKFARHTLFPGILAAHLMLFGGMQSVLAQESGKPEVAPTATEALFSAFPEGGQEGVYFEEFVEPGTSHAFTLVLDNAGSRPLDLVVYPADVYSMVNGGMGVNFQNEERSEPTTWLDFPEGNVATDPDENVLQDFTVTVPEGTAPGQYVTAIAVETAESYAIGEEGGAFRQKLRKVVAVSILVPGEADPGFRIGEPQMAIIQGQTAMQLPIENTGNTRVRPTGTVSIVDLDGNEVASGDVAMGSVYTGDTAPFELWLPNALPVGEYTVSADLTDPDTGVSDSIQNVAVVLVPEATPVPPEAATPIVAPAATPVQVDPVTLVSTEIAANADPIQFAKVAFEIENTGNHISSSRATLGVSHNGELVEEFEIDDNLPLPVGTTSVEDRYIPPTGWESGIWTFSITVHSINTNGNVETVIVSEEDVATIEVP
jgi:hypothetical protein